MDRRTTIGLLVANVEDDFSNSICKGAMAAAEDHDADLIIIPGKYFNNNNNYKYDDKVKYEYQYNMLFYFGDNLHIDVLTGCIGSISIHLDDDKKRDMLSIFGEKPLITLASQEYDYPSLIFDNYTGLRDGIRYLIEQEHRTHLCMAAGEPDGLDNQERIHTFRSTLAEYGMAVSPSQIAYGDYTAECTQVIEQLLDDNPDTDAICCVNDHTAMAVYKVLKKRGIAIGTEIAVLGFDDVEQAEKMDPPLATVQANAEEMGYQAVLEALHLAETREKRQSIVKTRFILRQSACRTPLSLPAEDNHKLMLEMYGKLREMYSLNHITNIISRDMLMFEENEEENVYLSLLRQLHEIDIQNSFLYIYKEPIPYYNGEAWKSPDTVLLKAYQKDRQIYYLPPEQQEIATEDIFSNRFCTWENRHTYMMIDLYSNELQYGICLCDIGHKFFHYAEFMTYQLSAASKIIRLLHQQQSTLRQLDSISKNDELTGIYNRRGFYVEAERYLTRNSAHMPYIYTVYADLDHLKPINDNYGHEEGDFAISHCARILADTFSDSGIVGRMGGDEFAAVLLHDDPDFEPLLRTQIAQKLETLNASIDKPYAIGMSVGIFRSNYPDYPAENSLEQLLTSADKLLYLQKKNR